MRLRSLRLTSLYEGGIGLNMSRRVGILERLAKGPVVGDGSMALTLEKRGYCKAGPFTPEAVVEYPEGVLQLHREFVRAGADVVQTCSFYSSDDKLAYGRSDKSKVRHTSTELNDAACRLARIAADEGNCLVAAGLSPVPSFGQGLSEEIVRAEFAKQVEVFSQHDIDFVIAEFFIDVREIEMCAKEMKKLNKPMALSMRIGIHGDLKGVSAGECAVRMAKTGAEIVGINCSFDVDTALKVIQLMKQELEKNDLHPYLICQPLGFLAPEVSDTIHGRNCLPENPLGVEARLLTRIDVHKFARAAYNLGVHYVGGCCAFEPHHIRAIAQELALERGKDPPCADLCDSLGKEGTNRLKNPERQSKEYWYNVKPGTGRPHHAALSNLVPTSVDVRP